MEKWDWNFDDDEMDRTNGKILFGFLVLMVITFIVFLLINQE